MVCKRDHQVSVCFPSFRTPSLFSKVTNYIHPIYLNQKHPSENQPPSMGPIVHSISLLEAPSLFRNFSDSKGKDTCEQGWDQLCLILLSIRFQYLYLSCFYRTQVYLGSDLWVRVSQTNSNTLLKQVMQVMQVMQVICKLCK